MFQAKSTASTSLTKAKEIASLIIPSATPILNSSKTVLIL